MILPTRAEDHYGKSASETHLKNDGEVLTEVTMNFRFTEIPRLSAPNVAISNYGAGLAERVTTV